MKICDPSRLLVFSLSGSHIVIVKWNEMKQNHTLRKEPKGEIERKENTVQLDSHFWLSEKFSLHHRVTKYKSHIFASFKLHHPHHCRFCNEGDSPVREPVFRSEMKVLANSVATDWAGDKLLIKTGTPCLFRWHNTEEQHQDYLSNAPPPTVVPRGGRGGGGGGGGQMLMFQIDRCVRVAFFCWVDVRKCMMH